MPRIIARPSWSSVAAVIAVIAAERPGIWKIAEPSRIFDVAWASQPRIVAARRSRTRPSTRSRSRAARPPAPGPA